MTEDRYEFEPNLKRAAVVADEAYTVSLWRGKVRTHLGAVEHSPGDEGCWRAWSGGQIPGEFATREQAAAHLHMAVAESAFRDYVEAGNLLRRVDKYGRADEVHPSAEALVAELLGVESMIDEAKARLAKLMPLAQAMTKP